MGWGSGLGMMGRGFNFAFLPAFSLRAVELEDRVIRPWVQRCTIIYRMPSLGRFLKGRAVKVAAIFALHRRYLCIVRT